MSATRRAVGAAPIAATSERFWATTFRPTSWAVDHSSRQSRPRTIVSVVATTEPDGAQHDGGVVARADGGRVAHDAPGRGVPGHDAGQELGLVEVAQPFHQDLPAMTAGHPAR